ncbi:uncharacterized protein LOC114575048 [Exaiptasia diaphana]|uniref:Ig-like domain-containing protein n=1 Tax=Exaiptasia diaphana TaxID=2652724 RepID=A0A913YHN9_EXADI|nr:uncharacterized protein LOC114575048 [Exaiptasia diaphana]
MNTWMWFICLWILVICGQSGRSSRPPVAKLQVIISSSRGRIAPEGCKVRFRCVANSTDGRVNAYNWLVNGSRISATDKYHINYYYKHKKLIRYSTLIVVNVSRHIDEGFYSCIAITRLGSAISNQALLQVAYFDVLENSSSTFFLIKSLQSITLHPPSARIFPTRRVTWFDQNRNIIKDGYSQSYISSDGSLNIIGVRNVTEEYRCIVENVVTGENYVMYYKISVQGEYINYIY